MHKKNIFDISNIKNFQEEIFENILANSGEIRKIERIISKGQSTPENIFYDQDCAELVFLLQGNAEIEFENEFKIKLESGDYITIYEHQKHRVTYTSKEPECIWLAIHYKLCLP